ncbi:YIP1 family protein [Sandaracinus amylolyticus]|uniref:YIP1 family protein n=1 Tax=Sandaracinus amylolyticus TaxID=927083 RepID=UPI001F248B14|nr:YIP1 family protein [Sandaracinus amylolyticus]UJR84264.1 Hypothetical protein I5071_63410 [Sandaracinus amylolyticus]
MSHEGAHCGVHEARDARFTCERCGTFGCAECRFGGEPPENAPPRFAICVACAKDGFAEPIPWERRKELGIRHAFIETTKLATREPTRFFRTPAIEKGPTGALFYGLGAYALGQITLLLSMGLLMAAGGAVAGIATEEPMVAGVLGAYGCAIAGFSPFFVAQGIAQTLLAVIIAAGASHGTLVVMKRAKGKFESTLRAVAYSYAPYVWLGLPVCGGLIAYVWMIAIEFRAIRETHQCGSDGAALAVFGYRMLLVLLFIGLYAAIGVLMFLYMPGPRPGFDPVTSP